MTSSISILNEPRPWAFGRTDLAAGLRAYTGDATLVVDEIHEQLLPNQRPSVGRIRGLIVTCDTASGKQNFNLVVKEPQGATRTGTAGAGLREASLYRIMAEQLPVQVPRLFAADVNGGWLVMERLPQTRPPETWHADDYVLAVQQLVILHDRFWGLGTDLAAYTWLARPLDSDFDIYFQAANSGIRRLVDKVTSNLITRDRRLIGMLQRLVQHSDQIASTLRAAPATLLHGDYWPGNLTFRDDGRLVVYDWQQASIGPGVLDLFHFVQASQWYFSPLPISTQELVTIYRAGLEGSLGQFWSENEWSTLWDYALLWTFLTNWVDLLASIPAAILQTRYPQMKTLWLEPVAAALQRCFPGE